MCFGEKACRCFILGSELPRDGRRLHYASANIATPLRSVVAGTAPWWCVTGSDLQLQLQMSLIMTELFHSITSAGSYVGIYPTCLYVSNFFGNRCAAHSVSALFRLSGCYNIQMGPVRKLRRMIFCRQVSWQERHRFCIQMHRAVTWPSTPPPSGGVSLDQWQHYVRFTTSWH